MYDVPWERETENFWYSYPCGPVALSCVTGWHPEKIIKLILAYRKKNPPDKNEWECSANYLNDSSSTYLGEILYILRKRFKRKFYAKNQAGKIFVKNFVFENRKNLYFVLSQDEKQGHALICYDNYIFDTLGLRAPNSTDSRRNRVICFIKLNKKPLKKSFWYLTRR